jgi:hypothetical protein
LEEIWSTILPSEQTGIKYKKENMASKLSPIKKKTRVMSPIPYEYKVGDQVLLETPRILRKLWNPYTGPYPVTNVYKNGTIRIQKVIVSKDGISKELFHSINTPIKDDQNPKRICIKMSEYF